MKGKCSFGLDVTGGGGAGRRTVFREGDAIDAFPGLPWLLRPTQLETVSGVSVDGSTPSCSTDSSWNTCGALALNTLFLVTVVTPIPL